MGKEIDDAVYLRARRRRIEKPGRDQVIKGYGVAGIGVVKLSGRVGTLSARIESASIDRARADFSEVSPPLQVAWNDGKVVRSGQRMRVTLVVHEEKGAVFQVENLGDVDRASQSATELVKAICAFGQ